jgi:hypothetical protein
MSMSELDAFYSDTGGHRDGDNFDRLNAPLDTPQNADVMYYSAYHGAKRSECACGAGKWVMYTSKCGSADRIEHVYDLLDGSPGYGTRSRYYKKQ